MLAQILAAITGATLGSQGTKAHDNIDKIIKDSDRIDPSTIQEERYGTAPFGLFNLSKYGAKTKGGERREIFRSSMGLGTKDRQRDNYLNLLQEIAMNPDFADTLSRPASKLVDTEMDYEGNPLGFLKYLFSSKQ